MHTRARGQILGYVFLILPYFQAMTLLLYFYHTACSRRTNRLPSNVLSLSLISYVSPGITDACQNIQLFFKMWILGSRLWPWDLYSDSLYLMNHLGGHKAKFLKWVCVFRFIFSSLYSIWIEPEASHPFISKWSLRYLDSILPFLALCGYKWHLSHLA